MRLVFTAFCAASCVVVGCAADTFVGADGGGGDAGTKTVNIACASSTICTAGQACCVGLTSGWSAATCQPDTNENKLGCERYLSCSDAADCPTGHACCATIGSDGTGQTIVSTQCLSSCPATTTSAQLCNKNAPNECLTGTCNDWKRHPRLGDDLPTVAVSPAFSLTRRAARLDSASPNLWGTFSGVFTLMKLRT